jgi:chorismate mutase/prephenate dehydratase
MEIIHRNVEDRPDNTTRFIIIGRQDTPPSGNDKTSVIVSGKNRPGLLYSVLEPFKRHGINLTRLESRPSHAEKWNYVFFIDFEGHRDEAGVQKLLTELEADSLTIRFLGSYPKAVL